MEKIVMYTTRYCPYCVRARNFLNEKGVNFKDIDIYENSTVYSEVNSRTKWNMVPQIFIQGKFIGGYDDMKKLDDEGELDKLL